MFARYPYTRWPLGGLLIDSLKSRGMTRLQLVKALGYRNTNKGLRVLDRNLTTADLDLRLLEEVKDILGLDEKTLVDAVRSTIAKAEKEAEELARSRFRPYLFVLTELRIPEQIVFSIITGAEKRRRVRLPQDINLWPDEEQRDYLRNSIREHYQGKNDLLIQYFGSIRGYIYFPDYDPHGIEFSVDGEYVRHLEEPVSQPTAVLQVGRKELAVEKIPNWFRR